MYIFHRLPLLPFKNCNSTVDGVSVWPCRLHTHTHRERKGAKFFTSSTMNATPRTASSSTTNDKHQLKRIKWSDIDSYNIHRFARVCVCASRHLLPLPSPPFSLCLRCFGCFSSWQCQLLVFYIECANCRTQKQIIIFGNCEVKRVMRSVRMHGSEWSLADILYINESAPTAQ